MVNFTPDTDIPTLTGKVILITGGTDGLGKESVLQLSKHSPAHIYLAARSKSKADTAIQEINSRSPTACPITFLELDLSSFESIKSAVRTFSAAEPRLDILMCNAGLIGVKGTTKEGYETTFGVNHVGHALLIQLLKPLLEKTAKDQRQSSGGKSDVRVVVLGSDAEKMAPKDYYFLAPDQINSDLSNLSTFGRYGHSKIANIHYTSELARRYPEAEYGVKYVCVHPGAVSTNLGGDIMSGWPRTATVLRKVVGVLLRLVPVEEGARNQLWAATAPAEEVKEGVFYHPVALEGKGSSRVEERKKAEELWVWTEKELEGHV